MAMHFDNDSTALETAVSHENVRAAEGRTCDVDMAEALVSLARRQQAGQAMLAQANQSPASVLSLLQQ